MSEVAIKVNNGVKSFDGGVEKVLDGLNLRVPRGSLYVLLGASGQGKTCLFSCIVGLRRLNHGSIEIFGKSIKTGQRSPSSVIGYMPQELGLQEEMTILEIWHYYGRMYGMSPNVIKRKGTELQGILQIPPHSKNVKECSGGEKKRLSLLVALLNSPKILILDEPCVSSDPLLRRNIWSLLKRMVTENFSTVILSTHYTEEAKNGDIVGVMRNGKIVVEESPKFMLELYNTNLLENAVREIYRDDTHQLQSISVQPNTKIAKIEHETYYKERSSIKKTGIYHLKICWSLLLSQCSVFRRHPLILLIILIFPSIHTNSTITTFKNDPSSILGVVNNDVKDGLGDQFIKQLPSVVTTVNYGSESEALDSVHLGNSDGYITINSNFTQFMTQRAVFGIFSDNETIQGSTIGVVLDQSGANWISSKFLVSNLISAFNRFAQAQLAMYTNSSSSSNSSVKDEYFSVNHKLNELGYREVSWGDMFLPGSILGCIIVLPMTIGVPMIWDKKRGVKDRSYIAGGGIFHSCLAYLISYSSLIFASVLIWLLGVWVGLVNYQIPDGSTLSFIYICVLEGVVGLCCGFMFATLFDHEVEVVVAIVFLYAPAVICSSGLWAAESMDVVTRWTIRMLPLSLPVQALQNISLRGWGLCHKGVLEGVVLQWAWIVGTLTIAFIYDRRCRR